VLISVQRSAKWDGVGFSNQWREAWGGRVRVASGYHSKGYLYYHFNDKDGFIRELLHETDRITELLEHEFFNGLDLARDPFRAFMKVYGVYYERYPDYVRFFCLFHFCSLKVQMCSEFYGRMIQGEAFLEANLKRINPEETSKLSIPFQPGRWDTRW
jgi:AcrR family transcriptional regulator